MKNQPLFWHVIKSKSDKKNETCVDEWYEDEYIYSNCGHNKCDPNYIYDYDDHNDCKHCICGEKHIYNQHYMKHNRTNEIIIIGSQCIKKFMPDAWDHHLLTLKQKKQLFKQQIKTIEGHLEIFFSMLQKRCYKCYDKYNNCFKCNDLPKGYLFKLSDPHQEWFIRNKATYGSPLKIRQFLERKEKNLKELENTYNELINKLNNIDDEMAKLNLKSKIDFNRYHTIYETNIKL